MLLGSQVNHSTDDGERWTNLMRSTPRAHYRISLPYVYSKDTGKIRTTSFIFADDNLDIAGSHYSIKKSSFNLVTISDLNYGVLFKTEPDSEAFKFIIDHYMDWAVKYNVSFARINSWLPKIISGKINNTTVEIEDYLLSKGFKIVADPKHTYYIDLSQSEDELLRRMHKQTRYRIMQGLRSDIKTIIYEKPDQWIINQFWNQYKALSENKKFNAYSEEKFKNELLTLTNAGLAKIFIEKFDNTIVNFSVASDFGIAYYMHGAINPEYKRLKGCPSPGQLAQWEMIKQAKANGASIYDMGFCPGPIPLPEHPRFAIWSFKHGFGGDPVEFLPVYGKILKPLRGRLFFTLKKKNEQA